MIDIDLYVQVNTYITYAILNANYTENGIEYAQRVIPFNELPQYVLDYLQTNNYIHIDR